MTELHTLGGGGRGGGEGPAESALWLLYAVMSIYDFWISCVVRVSMKGC